MNTNNLSVFLPNCIVRAKTENPNKEIFIFNTITVGFGCSIGHCLRRTLLFHCLSASPVKIKASGCMHEHDTAPGIKESMFMVIAALRAMPVSVSVEFEDLKVLSITLPVEKKVIKCKDLPRVSGLDFPDDEYVLFETTGTDPVSMTVWFACGRASDDESSVQQRVNATSFDISSIDIKHLFKPVDKVAVDVTPTRKGNKQFDCLALTITTDGSISPSNALDQAIKTYFGEVASSLLKMEIVAEGEAVMSDDISAHTTEMSLKTLGLTPAIARCLEQIGLETVYDVVNLPLHVIEDTPELTEPVLHNINSALQRKHKDLYLKSFAAPQN